MALSWETMKNEISTRFKAEVTDVISGGLTTIHDNDPTPKPEDARWCRVTILPGESVQADFGSATKRYRTPGVMIAQIYTPVGDGDKDSSVVADAIKIAFRNKKVGSIEYMTPSMVVAGRTNDNKWWQVNVSCPFRADDVA